MNAARIARMCALGAIACGCTVGPDFRTPDPPSVDRYVADPQPVAGGMVRLAAERDIPAEWWAVFGSDELDALVRRALERSPTLDAARARLAQARELRTARAGATAYPQVDATFGAVRQRIDPATFGFPEAPNPGPFNVFTFGADVSYNFDLFGGNRRELEALAAEVDYQAFELEGARLTVASNVVAAAIRRAALEAQIEAASAILSAQRQQQDIVEQRYQLGGVAWLDVQNQRALVAQTAAAVAPLSAQWAQAGHELAALMGDPPAQADRPRIGLHELELPAELPLRIPSEMVRQRPDIRASEALLHKASANVGVATADLYPKLVISGGFSTNQLNIGDLLGNGINIWNTGANLLQPLFRGGELQARRRAAIAAYDQAAAAYRGSVMNGLQNVADVLRALEGDGQALAARTEQAGPRRRCLPDRAGAIPCRRRQPAHVPGRRAATVQAESERLQALANRYADAAALFQALGGGWQ